MPYIAQDLEHKKLGKSIGSGECVALVQTWAQAPNTALWRPGTQVKNNGGHIQKGTAIATFVDGHYPSEGRHAAFFLSEDSTGIRVIDQWHGQGAHERTIHYGGTSGRQNDGNAFYVIE
jgi:hypothetical protein